MPTLVITSQQNERVKLVHSLQHQGKLRRKHNQIVLEGVRLIGDALTLGVSPLFVLHTIEESETSTLAALLARLRVLGIPCLEITSAVMEYVADTQTPQGIMAVVPMPSLPMPAVTGFVLILDGVADPGNMGTILRTAAAAGADGVILAPGCVDPFNPKALRSGMGAHFRIPITHQHWPEIIADHPGLPLYLADAAGTAPYYGVEWAQPAGLIIGGEARGADDQGRAAASGVIAIPMANAAESINAAAAAAVILFEIRRQRSIAAQ